jgi:hypothetical protein
VQSRPAGPEVPASAAPATENRMHRAVPGGRDGCGGERHSTVVEREACGRRPGNRSAQGPTATLGARLREARAGRRRLCACAAAGSSAHPGLPAHGAAPPHGGRRSVWYLAGARGGLEDARNGGGGGGQGGAVAAVAGRALERRRRRRQLRVSRRSRRGEEAVALPAVAGAGDGARLSQDRGPRRALRPQVSAVRPGGRSRRWGAPGRRDPGPGNGGGRLRRVGSGGRDACSPGPVAPLSRPGPAWPSAAPAPPLLAAAASRPAPVPPAPGARVRSPSPRQGLRPRGPRVGTAQRRPGLREAEAGSVWGGARRAPRPRAGLCCGGPGVRPTWRRSAECEPRRALPAFPLRALPGRPEAASAFSSCSDPRRLRGDPRGLSLHCAVGKNAAASLVYVTREETRERLAGQLGPSLVCRVPTV